MLYLNTYEGANYLINKHQLSILLRYRHVITRAGSTVTNITSNGYSIGG